VIAKCEEPELFSALSASAIFKTFRAYSNRVCWKPPQVPVKGQSCVRANSMPRNIPVKLL
jgi:hypothetical protein